MPSLGEFLGALLFDAAQARARADVETIRMAQVYSRDPLLRNLPVPRFRLPDITVDVPVLITQLSGASAAGGGLLFEEPTAAELRDVARTSVRAAAVRLPRTVAQRVPSELVERVRTFLASGSLRLLSPTAVSEDVAGMLADIVGSLSDAPPPAEQMERLRDAARSAMSDLIAGKLRPSLSWQVAVTAEEIRAHGDNNSVVHLRLTVSEEGYEVIERADGKSFQLTPE